MSAWRPPNRDLREMVDHKEFRQDWSTVSMVEIRPPRLAERKEDLPLSNANLSSGWPPSTKTDPRTAPRNQTFRPGSWPGNVRESENVLAHACMMCEGDTIDLPDYPEHLKAPAAQATTGDEGLLPMAEVHKRHALRGAGRGPRQQGHILGVHRATLYRLIEEFDPQEIKAAGG